MLANFATKAQEQLYIKFLCNVSADFPIPASKADL